MDRGLVQFGLWSYGLNLETPVTHGLPMVHTNEDEENEEDREDEGDKDKGLERDGGSSDTDDV